MTNRYEDALDFCEMVLEIGMPEDTVIPVWPIETEMAITHPLTVGMVVKIRSALKLAQEAEQLRKERDEFKELYDVMVERYTELAKKVAGE